MKLSRQFPLNALRVFEAVARHLSFTRAGEELGMTQTAVSYQIKLLEENIGEPLVLRRPRQVALTEAGERLLPKVREGFELLHEAVETLRAPAHDTLVIHSTPTFAQQWLARYLGAFQIRHPQIAVRLSTSQEVIDFSRTAVDVAIRWGTGDWPGLTAHKVMRMNFAPLLSPALAPKGTLKVPADLMKLPIVSARDPWWKTWFKEAGLENPGLERYPPNEFGTQAIDVGMALAAQGVAIANPGHFREEIAEGRLYQPFDITCNDGRDYWLVCQEARRNVGKIKAFREWILEAMPREV